MPEKTTEQIQRELRHLEARLPEARAELEGIPGVVDVRAGIREKGGMATEQVVFHVFVERKRPLMEIPPEHRVPPVVAGFPTDVIEVTGAVPEAEVLTGGMRVTQSLWGLSYGTLGAFATTTAANAHLPVDTPVLLTNNHVASSVGDLVGIDCLCDSWCCRCCEIGEVVDSQLTNEVDGAIARLNDDVRFSHEILGIGAIRGQGTAVIGTRILKYGHRTGFTNGAVTSDVAPSNRTDGASFINQIRVAPRPPSTDMSQGGDSGSVYVDADTRSVVGLHHAGSGPTSTGNHIGPVATLLDIEFPTMGTAGAIPLTGSAFEPDRPTVLDAVTALRAELERTETGRRWLELVHTHAREVRELVNHDRETQVAWQRHQGPAFVAHFMRSARVADHRVPDEVEGVRIQNLILAMAATLERSGSPELAAAITEHYLTALQLSERCDTAAALIDRSRELAISAGAVPATAEAR